MANVNGTYYAKQADPSSDNILDRGVLRGKVRVMFDTYEFASTVAGTTVNIGKDLKAGDRILDVWLIADAMGDAGVSFEVGDSDDADRYISATAQNTGNLRTDLDKIDGFNYEIGTNDGDETILVTTSSTSGNHLATGTLKVAVLYTEG